MAQGTFIDGAALSVVQGVINDNATDAQSRLLDLEADTLKAEVTIFTSKVNEAGGISIGEVVYVSGATGGIPQVALADNTDFSKADVLAISTETKSNSQNMICINSGILSGIDTSAFLEGDVLYLGATGAITNVHPIGVDAVQRIGHAVKINASTGSIFVELDSLTVVSTTDSTLRHQLVNLSAGTSASTGYTVVNEAGHRATMSLTGEGHGTAPEQMFLYNEGYGETDYWIDGDEDHVWYTDITDAHAFAATEKMRLTSTGELETICQLVTHVSTMTDDHALEIDCNAAGFGDVKAVDIDYITGAIATGQDEAIILINIDETAAVGGDIVGLEVISTEGGGDKVFGMLVGAGVGAIEQLTGEFDDFDTILEQSSDVTTALSTGGAGNVTIFSNDNDSVTVGLSVKFEEIEVILDTASGQNINPVFEYSTGIGTWATFTPIDGTNGIRNNGVIVWLDGDIPSWATGTGGEYLIRITRTRNSLSVIPIADLIKGASVEEHTWDKDGNISVNDIYGNGDLIVNPSASQTPTSNGELTFEATSNTSLTIKFKGSDGTVRTNVLTLT